MAITRSVSVVSVCAALALTVLVISGCGNIQLSPSRATALHNDEMIVFGRVQVVENGQSQTAALGKMHRPNVYFFSSRDRAPKLFSNKVRYGIVTDADGYFFAVVPALSYRLSLDLHSQFSEYDSEDQHFAIYPGVQLLRAAPGEAHYIGTLRIESQITGKKGVFMSGPKVCRLVSTSILDASAVAESEFRRRFPLDAHLGISKALLERNPDLPQGMFYYVTRTTGGAGDMLEGPATLVLWPVLIPMSVAAGQERKSVWEGSDQECRLYDSSSAPSLWPEAEPRRQPKQ